MEWRVYMPPRGPQDYEGDALLAPYGDTFWPTHAEACAFVVQVLDREETDRRHVRVRSFTVTLTSSIDDGGWGRFLTDVAGFVENTACDYAASCNFYKVIVLARSA